MAAVLPDHSHLQRLPAFLNLAGHSVTACGFHTAVAQIVSQPDNILFLLVKAAREKMAEIVGENFALIHSCPAAQGLHTAPDIAPVHRSASSGYKYTAADAFFLGTIGLQQLHQGSCQENITDFPLGINADSLLAQGFHGYI